MRKKQWKWIKNSKGSMCFFNIIVNYGKQISTKSFEATECVERISYVLFLSGITL